MKKRSNSILFWLCCFAAVLVLYITPFVLVLADHVSGINWYSEHAPDSLKRALRVLYSPINDIITHFLK